jgi:MoxR-like ATPase
MNREWKSGDIGKGESEIFSILRKEARECRSDPSILRYIRDIITETRVDEKVVLGASPRAGEQVLYASKAAATLAGRDYAIPDDVKRVVKKMLPHRLSLSLDSELEGISPELVVENILDRVEVVKQG